MVPSVGLHLHCWTSYGTLFSFALMAIVVLIISRLILGLPCPRPEAYTGGRISSLHPRHVIHYASWLAIATRLAL